MTVVAETSRLRLRHACAADADWLLQLMNEPAYLENIGDRGVRTVADAQVYIADNFEKSYRDNGHGLYVVEAKGEATPVGLCGLVRRDALPHPDIGFAFLERCWSRGYALESAQAVMQIAAGLKLSQVLGIVREGNVRSIRLLEKLGLQEQGEVWLPGVAASRRLYFRNLDLVLNAAGTR